MTLELVEVICTLVLASVVAIGRRLTKLGTANVVVPLPPYLESSKLPNVGYEEIV